MEAADEKPVPNGFELHKRSVVAGPSGPEDLLTGPLILIFHTLDMKSLLIIVF